MNITMERGVPDSGFNCLGKPVKSGKLLKTVRDVLDRAEQETSDDFMIC